MGVPAGRVKMGGQVDEVLQEAAERARSCTLNEPVKPARPPQAEPLSTGKKADVPLRTRPTRSGRPERATENATVE